MNDNQLKTAISASADYASRQAGATLGDRATCFLAALTGNVVLDRDLSHKLFSLMGVEDKINIPICAPEPVVPQPAPDQKGTPSPALPLMRPEVARHEIQGWMIVGALFLASVVALVMALSK